MDIQVKALPANIGCRQHELDLPVLVTKAYASKYPDPICFDVGATIQVERDDPEYPGWFWCRAPANKEGWVHHSFLAGQVGTTIAIRAYSAKELTVVEGERGRLIQLLDGWAFIRLDTGNTGWIPQSHFQRMLNNPVPVVP